MLDAKVLQHPEGVILSQGANAENWKCKDNFKSTQYINIFFKTGKYLEFVAFLFKTSMPKIVSITIFSLSYPSVLLVRKLFPGLIMSMFIFLIVKLQLHFYVTP